MKNLLTLALKLLFLVSFGHNVCEAQEQQMTLVQWNDEAKSNIRLLPKYGQVLKTESQMKSDQEFIETTLKLHTTSRNASNQMIDLGFKYLYRDIKTAMYRFNQAYLLDSTNTDIYWGYGGVYMNLGDYERAEKQYQEGLAIDPTNTHLLTDYGTFFLSQYYERQPTDEKSALSNLELAISYLEKSYKLVGSDQSTTYKLSICYWNKGDCENAWKYYDISKNIGGRNIDEDYVADLNGKCPRK